MKKLLAVLLAAALVVSMFACTSAPEETKGTEAEKTTEATSQDTTAADETQGESGEITPAADGTYCSTEPIVNIGTFTKDQVKAGVLITAVGQSGDDSMMASIAKKAGVEAQNNATAKAEDLANVGTLIVVTGASSKGLGAAGISTDDELARAKALLSAAKDAGVVVIVAHIGGTSRRGTLSDEFIKVTFDYAQYFLVVDEGNAADGLFTNYAKSNNVPITLVKSKTNLVDPIKALFN